MTFMTQLTLVYLPDPPSLMGRWRDSQNRIIPGFELNHEELNINLSRIHVVVTITLALSDRDRLMLTADQLHLSRG